MHDSWNKHAHAHHTGSQSKQFFFKKLKKKNKTKQNTIKSKLALTMNSAGFIPKRSRKYLQIR